LGGGAFWAGGPKNARGCQELFLHPPDFSFKNTIYTPFIYVWF